MNYGDFSNPAQGYNSVGSSYDYLNPSYTLENLNDKELWNFYNRLRIFAELNDKESLAAKTLNNWLMNKAEFLVLKNNKLVYLESIKEHLLKDVRPVILSQKPVFRQDESKMKILGIKARITGYKDEDYNIPKADLTKPINLTYEGESLEIVTTGEFNEIQKKRKANPNSLSPVEIDKADVYSSFHTSTVHSEIKLRVIEMTPQKKYFIKFINWQIKIVDNYNWDADELNKTKADLAKLIYHHLHLPNPDFGNPFKVEKPVLKDQQYIDINHKYAKKVETAGLAKPYDFESLPWVVTNEELIKNYILEI